MKRTLLFFAMALAAGNAFSQFPVSSLFPMGVSHISYGDTMLNTTAVLKREGIRKVTAYQTSSVNEKSWRNEYLVRDGRVDARYECFRRSPRNDSGFCSRDTILYDDKGRILELRAMDAAGTVYLQLKVDYPAKGKVQYAWFAKGPQDADPHKDTSIHFYNDKGQLVRRVYEGMGLLNSASVYYGADGFPDSIVHDNPQFGTFVFERKQKRKTTSVVLEFRRKRYEWTYNASGQCITYEQRLKTKGRAEEAAAPKPDMEVKYYYNNDGTLAKVVEKSAGGKTTTTVYTYSK